VLFDTVAARVPASALSATFLDSLAAAGPGAGRVDYAVALRALAEVVRGRVDADSFRVTLVTRPRWEGWSAGLGALRAAVWPGVIRVVEVGAGAAERPGGGVAERPEAATEAGAAGGLAEVIRGDSAISGEQTGRGYVEAALKALGWEVGVGEVGELVIVPSHDPSLPHDEQREVLARAGAGATVVVAGEPGAGPLREALPWVWPAGGRGSPGALILGPTVSSAGAPISAGAPMLPGAESRFPGHPRPGARLLAVWEDGRPAAAAAREGTGCLVYLATGLEAGELPLDPGFPALLDRLLRGCDEGRGATRDERPLDLGGRRVLAGGFGATVDGRVSDGAVPPRTISAAVASAALGKVPGWPLGGWVLLVAFAVAVAETVLASRGRGA
jgi:hypothetical protein